MSVRRIRVFPDPILRKKCRVVKRIDHSVRELALDMVETMDAANGVGRAANQVGVLKRVVTLHLPEQQDAIILINPEIRDKSGEREVLEGCLSFPGYEGMVKRSVTVKARWLDENGSKMKISTEDLFAQALEHEIDHLNGILYVDHLLEHQRLAAAGTHMNEESPHMHDLELEVRADHDDTAEMSTEDNIEVVHTTVKFSELYSDSSVHQMQYDLRRAGYVIDQPDIDGLNKIESDNPNLDGGIILDSESNK